MEIKWKEGIWWVNVHSNQEVLIGTADGVIRAWTVRRLVESRRWDRHGLKGTPKRPDPKSQGMDAPIRTSVTLADQTAEVGLMRRPPADINRSVYLKGEDLEKYGYTAGCDGCRRPKAGLTGYKHHTTECRKRMETIMGVDRHQRFERTLNRRLEMEEAACTPTMAGGSGLTPEQRKCGREEADQAQQI